MSLFYPNFEGLQRKNWLKSKIEKKSYIVRMTSKTLQKKNSASSDESSMNPSGLLSSIPF